MIIAKGDSDYISEKFSGEELKKIDVVQQEMDRVTIALQLALDAKEFSYNVDFAIREGAMAFICDTTAEIEKKFKGSDFSSDVKALDRAVQEGENLQTTINRNLSMSLLRRQPISEEAVAQYFSHLHHAGDIIVSSTWTCVNTIKSALPLEAGLEDLHRDADAILSDCKEMFSPNFPKIENLIRKYENVPPSPRS